MTVEQTIDAGDQIEFEESDDEEGEQLEIPGRARAIYTDKGDPEVDSLYTRWKTGELVLQPDFQRQFVWDSAKSSRLIESALLEIPLPVIYLAEDDERLLVIDGQQRLTAFFSFIDGKFPDGREFKLGGLGVLSDLNGAKFTGLSKAQQARVKRCSLRAITFKQESYPELKFEVFRRLNTGAVSLNDQELRNCVYRGPYNDLLRELAQLADFRHIAGLNKQERRMRDVELVLRFAAFFHATYLKYQPPMRSFLNRDMVRHKSISEADAYALRDAFKNTTAIIRSLLDTRAFKRFYPGDEKDPNGRWEPKRFNSSLYDILMFSFASEDKNRVYQHLDSVREALIALMTTDQEFIRSIEISTSSVQAVTTRFDRWRSALQAVLGTGQKEPRCFSQALKDEMYADNTTCAICGQAIRSVDDGALDHIEQYWLGGKTVPENARLTHRYCNMARPRHERA